MSSYARSALMVALTVAVCTGCYSATYYGVEQRGEIEKLHRSLARHDRAIRNLEAEVGTRARLPLLERWNEKVLQMSAPAVGQFMRSPVQLVSLVAPAAPVEPMVQPAIAPAKPATAPAPTVVQVRFDAAPAATTPAAEPAALVRVAWPDAGGPRQSNQP